MTTDAMLRVIVPAAVADKARHRAETEGKTIAEAVAELLDAYGKGKPKPKRGKD